MLNVNKDLYIKYITNLRLSSRKMNITGVAEVAAAPRARC